MKNSAISSASPSFTYEACERHSLQAGGSRFLAQSPLFSPGSNQEVSHRPFQVYIPTLAVVLIFISPLSWFLLHPSYLSFRLRGSSTPNSSSHPFPQGPHTLWITPEPCGGWRCEGSVSRGELHVSFTSLRLFLPFLPRHITGSQTGLVGSDLKDHLVPVPCHG